MRLIDADELMEIVVQEGRVTVDDILCAATVEAVPVVYCRECKYHHWEQEPSHGRTEHYCALHNGLVTVTRETFCSYGRRREY